MSILHRVFQSRFLAISYVIMLLIASSCTVTPVPASNSPVQIESESPLIPGINTFLIENRWRLIEITYRSVAVEFEAIQPIYLTFTADGQLIKETTDCNSGGYYIIASSERKYHLEPGTGTAQDCGEAGNQQYDRITEAIAATTAYEIEGNQLFLTGDDVRIILEVDNVH